MGSRMKISVKALIGLVLLGLGLGCSGGQPAPYVPDEIISTVQSTGYSLNVSPSPLNEDIDGDQWLDAILFGATARTDPRLPNYSYFQGLIEADKHIVIAGQVRIVGGVVGADTGVVALYAGAMMTANPYAFTGAGNSLTGGEPGIRTRVGEWKEIPNP